MFTKIVNSYNSTIDQPVTNEYPTKENSFKQPCLHFIVGQRTSGKSYLTSKILAQTHKDKTFDRIYIITPSFNSNKSYFGKYIKEEDVFEPTKDSIAKVIASVEAERDEWEAYLKKVNSYNSTIDQPVTNEYNTKEDSFKQPCLHFIVGQRTSGKSYLT